MRSIVTDGIVVRSYASSLSSRATMRYKAHRSSCRYANATMEPMAVVADRIGADKMRTRILIGIVEPCATCQPTLLTEVPDAATTTTPIVTPPCPSCGHALTAAYDDGKGFWECDGCGRDVEDRDLRN